MLHFWCRYLELESSGHRNEIRLHYRSGSHRSHTEVFPYILADDKWHRLSLAISASHLILHVDCNKIYERVVEKPFMDLPVGTTFWLGQRNSAHGYFKGVMQDVQLLVMPQGFISQCPDLNRTCPTCNDFHGLVQKIMELQDILAKTSAKLSRAEQRMNRLDQCYCERTCTVKGATYREFDSWTDGCKNCTCMNGTIQCEALICPHFDCLHNSAPAYVDGKCCKECQHECASVSSLEEMIHPKSGFRPGYGTESALVALYNDLCREKDRGSASLLVLLDLSVAFDTIDHGILLDRLAGLGVGGTALQWFHSYLNGQFQKVVLGDYGSAPWQLCHGVPKGSILSPLLFNIYMKPLGEVIRRCGLWNHQYTDDTQLYLSFSTNPGEAVAVLNWCLAEVMGWMRANKLKLNPDKTEVLLVGGSGFGEGDLKVALPPRDKVRSLGVLLDPELSLEAQVTAAARSAFLQLRLIHQLHPYLEYNCLATVTHVLVTSRLDFCNALYVGLPLKMVQILQLVQNRAARLLTGTGCYVHMTPVLRQLHWLPIEVWAQFKVLVMTYKALNGLGPGYLKERLHPYMPSCPLRLAGEALLREPSMKEIRRHKCNAGFPVGMLNVANEINIAVSNDTKSMIPNQSICVFEGKTYFEGERETVHANSGDCILFECKDYKMQRLMKSDCPALNCPESQQISLCNSCCKVCKGHNFCSEGHKCLENSFCRNLEDRAVCSCRDGFRALREDNAYCEDIDECAEGRHYCRENTMCVNTPGSFMCICKTGYIRIDDYSCTDCGQMIMRIVCCQDQLTTMQHL
ncbi:Protein NEL [Varanus komodoensis]|nr:Protein NEL [Varanus komodoensis]